MKITIIAVGKIKEKYIKQGIKEFKKRLTNYTKLKIIEIPDEKAPENLSGKEMEMVKDTEGKNILKKLDNYSYVVSLDKDGSQLSSMDFAKKIKKLTVQGNSSFTFIIGGSLGLSDAVLKKSNLRLSFSKMTFPHQLFRLILLEQVYRTFRINRGEPYHK